ncbi:MAG: terpene cyclase/mutase family protein [Planctomycetota bacterium]|nr:terpene cyclase/mutase family protein [Planctomycetota bacterium]
MKTSWIGIFLVWVTGVSGLSTAFAADKWGKPGSVEVEEKIQQAVELGLAYLVSQQKSDGAFGVRKDFSVAVTSLSCLALMAGGNVPGRGRYGDSVRQGIEYILRCQQPSGYFTLPGDRSRMHGHGYAGLMLAQAHGMSPPSMQLKLRESIENAIQCTIASQTREGGWGYEPKAQQDHEGSITVCQLQFLRAARNGGFKVPIQTIRMATQYLMKSANPNGSFKYRLGMSSAGHRFPLTAAGISALNARGVDRENKELYGIVERGMTFMMKYLPPHGIQDRTYKNFFYYGHYYAAQAMYQARENAYWKRWYPEISRELVQRRFVKGGQQGYWVHQRYGNTYSTAIALMILQIEAQYLPIFQK